MALDLNELNKNKKSVIRYSDKKERTLAPFESNPVEIGKKTVPESKAEKEYKRFGRVEERTDYLLEKARKAEAKTVTETSSNSNQPITKPSPNRNQIKRRASYLEFQCMKGIKKEILKLIREAAYEENGEWFAFVDTEQIKEKTQATSQVVRNTFYKIKDEEWFSVEHSSLSGVRLVKLNPENYGLKK